MRISGFKLGNPARGDVNAATLLPPTLFPREYREMRRRGAEKRRARALLVTSLAGMTLHIVVVTHAALVLLTDPERRVVVGEMGTRIWETCRSHMAESHTPGPPFPYGTRGTRVMKASLPSCRMGENEWP